MNYKWSNICCSIVFLFALLVFTSLVQASDNVIDLSQKRQVVLTYKIVNRTGTAASLSSYVDQTVTSAMGLILRHSPPSLRLEERRGSEDKTDLIIEISDSNQDRPTDPWERTSDVVYNYYPDHRLTIPEAGAGQGDPFIVSIFWDKIVERGRKPGLSSSTPDPLARVLLALTREIYGYVYSLKTRGSQISKIRSHPNSEHSRELFMIENEIRASQAVIDFTDRVVPDLQSLIYSNLVAELKQARAWEKGSLTNWRASREMQASGGLSRRSLSAPVRGQVLRFPSKSCRLFE